ncbi:MAG TPA: hypothetical protein VF840_01110 [Terriglobales bacterium]
MKKLSVALLALVVLISLSALAQYGSDKQDSTGKKDSSAKTSAGPAAKDVVGTIGKDGKTFTGDKDKKSWKLVNPEAVKGHEGHHVKLNAHFYPDKGEAHVMSLSMNTGDSMKKDEMKH